MSDNLILWLRRDLRLADNPALAAALARGARILPLYIHAPEEEAPWTRGAASRWWLHQSLAALDRQLRALGSRLVIARGASLAELRRMVAASGACGVYWNRLYDPATRERDSRIKQALRAEGLECESFNGALLVEPWEVLKGDGEPYRVFSAFWRQAAKRLPEQVLAAPGALPAPDKSPAGLPLEALELLPRIGWDSGLAATWTAGEPRAWAALERFIGAALADYGEGRNRPDQPSTSRLSAHLHFGELSPRQILAALRARGFDPLAKPAEPFVRELGWREFGYHLLYHFPHTTERPLDERFADFPWALDEAAERLERWQQGATGIPLVDAGMRELWHSGWMHNRTRMVVASLLTKNLLIPWQEGARWFWDTLVDADLANNTLGWQWTAGCGADAAPYFRIFNPVLQGQRFDPEGAYVRRWCPELARLPAKFIHQPWSAPDPILRAAGVQLGATYPRPLIDLATSRERALGLWDQLKGG